MELTNKVALITGASSGIGAATARHLATQGAHAILIARNTDNLAKVHADITAAGHTATYYPCDVTNPDAVTNLAQQVLDTHGTPDILINNAGAGRWLFLDETPMFELDAMTGAPYLAALYVTRAFLPNMLKHGTGAIVNINSPVSRLPWPGATGYAGARWALRGFTQTLRMDLKGTGITVTEVIPGKVSSDYFTNNPGSEERIPTIGKLIPTVTPEQVAQAVTNAIRHNRREHLMPWQLKAFDITGRLLPRTYDYLLWRTGTHHPTMQAK
jgi:short-subunit dehydrogenase